MACQRGVAVVTALLLTTLAITIVGSLFWQQQVQVRSIENQRLQLQKQWILRGALDWARLILRADKQIKKQINRNVDYLGDAWAVPLAETRLDQYVDNAEASTDMPDAVVSGGIVDAQSRFNLSNLYQGGQIKEEQVRVFEKLLTNLRLNPSLARATANQMAAAVKPASDAQGTGGGRTDTSAPQPMNILYVDDLLSVPGFTPEILEALKDFVTVLQTNEVTEINVNTASAEVISARIDTLSVSDAAAIISGREIRAFNTKADFVSRLPGTNNSSVSNYIQLNSNYFLVNGNVRLNRAGLQMQALVDRRGDNPKVVWIREY
jgi:general secretion pathway protein K